MPKKCYVPIWIMLAYSAASAQTVDKPLLVGGDVTAPEVAHSVDPDYPRPKFFGRAKNADVQVSVVVDEHGMPQQLAIAKSGGKDFDQAALKAVRQYTFKPATLHESPVAVRLLIDINFRVYR